MFTMNPYSKFMQHGEVVSEKADRYDRNMAPEREKFRDAVGDNTVAVVDMTMGTVSRMINHGLSQLDRSSVPDVARILRQHGLGEKTATGTEIMRLFMGGGRFEHLDITGSRLEISDRAAAVVFTGSPMNISDALSERADERIRYKFQELEWTHAQVFERAVAIYRQAVERGLPVIGVCGGHHLVAQQNGGYVDKMSEEIRGVRPVTPNSEYGRDILRELAPNYGFNGTLYTAHGDEVIDLGVSSAQIMSSSGAGKHEKEAAIFSPDAQFTGDAKLDTQQILQVLEDGRHVALTLQSHPEQTLARLPINFVGGQSLSVIKEGDDAEVISHQILALITQLFSRHRNFKKPREI